MKHLFLLLILMLGSIYTNAQFLEFEKKYKAPNSFNECAAVFLNGKMLVDIYSPIGKCKVEEGIKGEMTLHSVILSDSGSISQKQLKFNVAIKNDRTNTMWMYNREPLNAVNIEDVIYQCDMGDKIYIILLNQKNSLMHHEIEVIRGC